MNGIVKCPGRVMSLQKKISKLLFDYNSYSVIHEGSQPADILAAWAIGDEEILLLLVDFPVSINDVILKDINQCIYTCW